MLARPRSNRARRYGDVVEATNGRTGERGDPVDPRALLLLGARETVFTNATAADAERRAATFTKIVPRTRAWRTHGATMMRNMIRQWHSIDAVWRAMERFEVSRGRRPRGNQTKALSTLALSRQP